MTSTKVGSIQPGRKVTYSRKRKDAAAGKNTVHILAGTAKQLPAIISGDNTTAESKMTPIEKMERSNLGISKKELETLKARTGLDYEKLARLLSVTRATLISKPAAQKFNPVLSERIVGLADIYSYGYEVFEDEEKFNQWVFEPNRALGGKTPFEVCNNQFGREEVKNMIGRIDYGVYS